MSNNDRDLTTNNKATKLAQFQIETRNIFTQLNYFTAKTKMLEKIILTLKRLTQEKSFSCFACVTKIFC